MTALFYKAISYVHEGKIPDAMIALEEYRTMSEKENLITNAIMSFRYQGFILSETGKPLEGITFYEKANDLLSKSTLPVTVKDNFEMESMLWHFYSLVAISDMQNAQTEADRCKTKVESRRNISEEMLFSGMMGLFELKKTNYDKALQHFTKADNLDPWIWYYIAASYDKKGDRQNALTLYEKISACNINSLNLALVRKAAKEQLKK
jgi:tetratricopeptide (TPR) repeat protein